MVDLWSRWGGGFWVLFPLELGAFIYIWGVWHVWRRAGRGHGVSYVRCAAFVGALLALVVALVSPLDYLSEQLFAAHMMQHLILILIAAPLLALSDLPLVLLWGLPSGVAQRLGRIWNRMRPAFQGLARPLSCWLLFTLILWVWHSPSLFEAALQHATVHALEHLAFLLSAMLFWNVVIRTVAHRGDTHPGIVLYLFTTAMQSGLLGALLTFAAQPWYPTYVAAAPRWDVTPLDDQQLAGLIMWLPMGAVFTVFALVYLGAWLSALEKRAPSRKIR
jgi:putative membrane protein